MTNSKLRDALLKRLKITFQALYARAKKLKTINAITTEDAIYVIAQKEGIILDKYLDKETIARVRSIIQQLNGAPRSIADSKATSRPKRGSREERRIVMISKEIEIIDPVLSSGKVSEAKEMAAIYPLLYILENSIRTVIDKIMLSKFGTNWWDSHAPKGLKETVEKRRADEEKNSWHQRRSDRPIDYLDLDQLPALARKIEKDLVPSIIPSNEWFGQLIEEVYKSRCVICHMNPLDKDSIQSVKLRLRHWEKQINPRKQIINGIS